ncbi:MAG TPA: hypothetical protein VNW90_27890 [Acetobacteraceae bacterium]|nr:hypothetical protein [Acetobacteraceae bacterium]
MSDAPPDNDEIRRRWSNVPIPDPSTITSREIERAKAELRTEFKQTVETQVLFAAEARRAIKEILETRIDAMDKSHAALQADVTRAVMESARDNAALEKLFGEKLNAVDIQFQGVQRLSEALQKAADTAINAAFLAADKAVVSQYNNFSQILQKIEASFTKEIDGLKALNGLNKDTFQNQLSALTGRLDRGEGNSSGAREFRTDNRAAIAMWAVVGGLAFGVVTWFVGFNFRHDAIPVAISTPPPAAAYGAPPGFVLTPLAPATPAPPAPR